MRASDVKPPAAYFEKEVRQRDILMLKSKHTIKQMPTITSPTKI